MTLISFSWIRRFRPGLVRQVRRMACCVALFGAGAVLVGCCGGIEPGAEPKFFRGEAVVERLSGRVGLVADGHYDPFSRGWRYRVRFSPTSDYSRGCDIAYGSDGVGSVWVAAYELRRADPAPARPDEALAPVGDRPSAPPSAPNS